MNKNNRKYRFASTKPAPAVTPGQSAPAVLSRDELRRIVAEMLG